jgi:drug/metabolite transporter (DMT)-like permease
VKKGIRKLPVDFKSFALLHGTFLLYSVAAIFMKAAGRPEVEQDITGILLRLGLAILAMAAYAILWQLTLKRMPLNFAYSNKAVCIFWSVLFGVVLFGDALTWGKAIGFLVVLVGVIIVVTDHE